MGKTNGHSRKLKCPVVLANGKKCGKAFSTINDLEQHIAQHFK